MKQLIKYFNSDKEKTRRANSKKAWDIYDGEIGKYVKDYVKQLLNLSPDELNQIPIVSSLNIAKSVVKELTGLYKNKTERTFFFNNESSMANDLLDDYYKKLKVNSVMLEINRAIEYEGDVHIGILPDKKGRLRVKVLKGYSLSVLEGSDETIYIIPAKFTHGGKIVDGFELWSETALVRTDKDGNTLETEELDLPYSPVFKASGVSFSDNYWKKGDYSLADFTIQFNALMTDVGHTIHLQSFSQPVFTKSARSSNFEDDVRVGKTEVLVLNTSEEGTEDFRFVSPSGDISGALDYVTAISKMFAKTKDVDSSVILGNLNKEAYNSGIQRLLAMIEKYDRSIEYAPIMLEAEEKFFKAVMAWLDYKGELSYDDRDYLTVVHQKPSMVKTLSEQIADELALEDLGAQDRVETISKVTSMSLEESERVYVKNKKSFNEKESNDNAGADGQDTL